MTDELIMLLPHHQALIEESGISSDIARARGYRSISAKAELARLGFGRNQCQVPALLIPVFDVHGDLATYQARPDSPRVQNGRPLKYETPGGSRMVLDVPRPIKEKLADPNIPLFITEGARKADSAVSQGLCCIALLGVWNWRGTNQLGGKTVLPDFESIALNGRDVYLAFDSDVVTKPAVRQALERFTAMLQSRKAHVRTILLPSGPHGIKTGLDDFLVAGNGVSDLLRCVVDTIPTSTSDADGDRHSPYMEVEGCIAYLKRLGETEIWVKLTNFTAEIREEIIADDGASERGELLIVGSLSNGRIFSPARIPMHRFESLLWVTGTWGTAAIIAAGSGNRDRVREAIQRLSPTVERRREYAHPGWRQIDGVWCFLTQDTVIGPEGAVSGISVRLDGSAHGIQLPSPPGADVLAQVIASTISLLELAPDRIMVPLLGAVFRALLNAMSQADHAVFLVGPSGVLKSELAAVTQRFFGVGFERTNLPASWAATSNFLERVAFDFKDCILVVDDFAPAGTPIDVRRYHSTADRVIRGAGNASGRGRMNADGSVRPSYPPRALILGTGEDVPAGYSIRARMIVLEIGKGDVDAALLTRYQDGSERAHLATMTAGFVRWLAHNFAQVCEGLQPAIQQLRHDLRAEGVHARTPDALAQLGAGWQLWTRFARDSGAITQDDAESLWTRVWAALRQLGTSQEPYLIQENPVERFLDLLAGSVASGAVHVAGPSGDEPDTPEAWGWRLRIIGSGDYTRQEWQPQGRCVGWLDDTGLYLETTAAFHAVQQLGSVSGTNLTVTATTLWKRLDEAGLLASTEMESRNTRLVRRTFAGARRKALHLRADVLSPRTPSQPDANMEFQESTIPSAEAPGSPPSNHEQESLPLQPRAGQSGQVGQENPAHPVSGVMTCVHCGSALPEGQPYACASCSRKYHGATDSP